MAGKSRSGRGGRGGGRRSGGSGGGRSRRPATNRQFPRTARLNALLQEIVADFFERVDDERFEMLTITGVEVDNDLNRAQVYVSALGTVPVSHPDADTGDGAPEPATQAESTAWNGQESSDDAPAPVDPDDSLIEALGDYRKAVQAKIGREARIRKTPEVVFAIDPAVRTGARIEEILASIGGSDDDGEGEAGSDGGERAAFTDPFSDEEE